MAVVIVTGASRGIGRAIVEILLAQTGTRVAAVARNCAPLAPLVQQHPSSLLTIEGDLAEDGRSGTVSQRVVEQVTAEYGSIDAIVFNAGVLDPVGPVAQADVEAWRLHFDVNLFSVARLLAAAMPSLRALHGRVVMVLSGASVKPYYGWGAYCASKAALNALAQQVVLEEPDVQAILVAPGVVNTSMQQDIREKFGANMTPESLKRFTDLHELGQLVAPEEPAAVYANLVLRGWDKPLNGGYFRYNGDELLAYR